ncbi:MAG: hypothetical protein ABIW16_02435 [Sphingomicrobium sp.]
MDTYREHPSDYQPAAADGARDDDVASAIGTDERRMHVRAYNHWVSLLDDRDYPSIEDLDPGAVKDFAGNSVLLDFTAGRDNPATPYIGAAIRAECGLGDTITSIADVPSRSLLSRLTDHYMQIIANRAPVGFEAEFDNQRGESICYRGILMPFSSDGDTIDFIYGVINWKQAEAPAARPAIVPMLPASGDDDDAPTAQYSVFDDSPLVLTDGVADTAKSHLAWEDGPLAEADTPLALPDVELDPAAGLADWLVAARETAELVKSADHRTRAALYRALAQAYDFALAAQAAPQDYAELLEESGVKAQARAPMTPVVKLVFGVDYDKTRLTEFAAALSYAQRQSVERGAFQSFLDRQSGGLKALVAAERDARRPEPRPDTAGEQARERLRHAPRMALTALPADEEFCLVVTRRGADGVHEAVALVADPTLIDKAIRRSAI